MNAITRFKKYYNGGNLLKAEEGAQVTPRNKQKLQTLLNSKQYGVAQDLWNYMMELNVNPRNAAAVLANIMAESGFNRDIVQKGGDRAKGFFQMHGLDLKAYNNWVAKNKDIIGRYPEVDYVLHMINNKDHPYTNEYRRVQSLPKTESNLQYINNVYGKRIANNRLYLIDDLNELWNNPDASLNDVTDSFVNTIERAGKPAYATRQAYANDFYNHFYGL